MGFWGTLGKIGKAAAPIAASFIPGVGPVASKALSAGIGMAGDIAGGFINSGAAKRAAGKQLEAANTAIGTFNEFGQQSRDTLGAARDAQRADASNIRDRQVAGMDPYASQGPDALAALQGNVYDEWQGGNFKAPTLTDDPGYQFRMNEGQKALERSSAARGTTGGGAFAKALTRFGQDYGSQEYGKAYQRSADEYDRTYGQFQDRSNQRWNRLSQLTDLGYDAAGRQAGYEGAYGDRLYGAESDFARGTTGVNQWQAGNEGDTQLRAGDVNAAGTVGATNAWNDTIQGVTDKFGQAMTSRGSTVAPSTTGRINPVTMPAGFGTQQRQPWNLPTSTRRYNPARVRSV